MAKNEDEDIVEPKAAALIESLRAFGYALPTALADLADNSLFHRAKKVAVHFHWAGDRSAIAISDDGEGMSAETLRDALRVGSRNPRDARDPGDFGRFGLGLKTASFSQCRRVSVFTRVSGTELTVRVWDLDHVAETNKWQLLRTPTELAVTLADKLLPAGHGTCIVWETLDRISEGTSINSDADEDAFLQLAEQVGQHFGTVFHQLMSGRGAVAFFLNGRPMKAWDPFLADEPATQRLPIERISFQGFDIEVEPFILPHLSKVDAKTHATASGINGWNAHQGFYIYRNRRLIVPGSWLGIKGWKQEEHYKLARIRVELPNAMDHAWEIDVTKSRARPPEKLRGELTRIGERTRSEAKKIYSFRGAKLIPAEGSERVLVWDRVAKHNQIAYRLNRDHPLYTQVRASCTDKDKLNALIRLIEETIPVPLITITDREMPDRTVGPFETSRDSEVMDIMRQAFAALRDSGLSTSEAVLRLGQLEPFPRFPQLLQAIREEYEK